MINPQILDPSKPVPKRDKTKKQENWVSSVDVTTTSGKQYHIDRQELDWIKNRYKQDNADSYGYDTADQQAKAAGQPSAKTLRSYTKSPVDQQLAQMGLPSEKNLDKYRGEYQQWHTGGIGKVFGNNISSGQWTKMKDFYKQDWNYENTAEDQERKRRGLMPAALEKNYTDTEIDDQLKASGLPSLKDLEKYNGQYWNYKGIDTLYSNVAREWANLRMNGVKNDGNDYPSADKLTEKPGTQWYADAFFNELNRKDENGEDVYGNIKGLFKNRTATTTEPDPSKDYVTELGKMVIGANKADALDEDFANYNAFSYDDFAKHYDEYYDKDVKSLKVQDGRSVEEAMNAVLKHEDEEAEKAFYTVDGRKDVKSFVDRYQRDFPDASDEKMFEDMYEHGLDDKLVKQAKKERQNAPGADKDKVSEAYAAAKSKYREDTFAVPNAEVANDDPVFRSGVAYASGKLKEYMDQNGGDIVAAKKALEDEGVLPEIIESAVSDMNASKGGTVRNEEAQPESEEVKNYDRVQSNKDSLRAYVDDAIANGADEKTVADITAAIEKSLSYAKDSDEGTISPNDVIAVLNGISDQEWVDATAMQKALEDYGFGSNGKLSGDAAALAYNWSKQDIRKVLNSIGSVRYEDFEPSDELVETLRANQGIDDIGDSPVFVTKDKKLDYEKFMHALDWANEQIANGMNEFDAYNILAADGYQDELEAYLPDKWHRALYAHERVKEAYKAENGDQNAWYESLTDEEKYQHGLDIWDSYTPEQQAEAFKGYNWKFDPAVYRTGKQAWEQQFAAILPGLAVNLTATPVKFADMISANLTGREKLWETTEDWMKAEATIGNWGKVNDTIGSGVKLADIAADATQEVARMMVLGTVGGAIGHGTKVGQALSEVVGNEAAKWGVRKIAGFGLTMMTSSPYVVSATAGNFAEAKAMGASTAEATRYGLITGTLEGVLESLNFDELWGKVLGANSFGKMIMEGGAAFKNAGVVAKARIANMVASGLGEFMEESASYVAETFLKMRHADTWGKGTEWDANDWLAQAGMGFLTGMLGSGMSSGAITKDSLLYEYWNSNPATRAALMNTETATGVWNGLSATKQEKYRSGDAKVLDMDQYAAMLTQEAILDNTINAKAKADYDNAVAKANKKYNAVKAIENNLRSEVAALSQADPEYASKLAKLDAKITKAAQDSDDASLVLKDETTKAQNTYEQTISNSRQQLNDIHRQTEEHYAALYLQNESAIKAKDAQAVTENVSKDMQNGATVNKDSVAEQTAVIEEKAKAKAAAEPTVSSIREAAYNRVYKDEAIGKQAAGEAGDGSKLNGLTRVAFADSERNNFQAKTSARFRRVTLELAGLELAKDGMSAKEIFAEAKKAMTPEAAQKLDVYTKLSKALGLNMVIRDVVAGTSGYVQDGKLYVTLNGKQNLLRVASHELTHYMKAHAASGYDTLRTHLINELGGQQAFDEMLVKKAEEYGYDLNTEDGKIAVDDEVCAELCEKMLENKDALERFANKDMSAAQKLKARLGRTLVAIKSAIRSIGTSNAKSNSDLIKEQETVEAWYTALSSAIDAANSNAKTKAKPTTETAAETTSKTAPTETRIIDPWTGEEIDLWSKSYKDWGHEGGSNSNYAVYLALKQVNPEMAKAYDDAVNGGPTDVLDAVINIADDVRQEQISPMAAATLLSNQYNADKTSLGSLFNQARNATQEAFQAAKQIDEQHGKPEANEALYMGEEDARREQLKSDLEKLAEKGTKVKGMKYAEVNELLDSVVLGDEQNYDKADYARVRGMLAQLIPDIVAYTNGDENVDMDQLNEKLNAAVDYMLGRYYEANSDELTALREAIPSKISLTDTAYKDLREAKEMTLREASRELSRALGKPVTLVYKRSPDYNNAEHLDTLWGKMENGLANGKPSFAEDVTALIDLVTDAREAGRTTFDDLYGSQREDVVNAQVGEFLDAVQSMVEGKAAETAALHSIDDDYLPLAERYDAGIATEEDMAEMQRAVDEAAEAAGVPSANYAPVIYDDDGNIITLSERFNPNETDIRNMLDDDWDALIQQYGAKPQGREPRASDIRVPNRVNDKTRVSDFGKSLMESKHMTNDMREEGKRLMLEQNWMSYEPKSDDKSMTEARSWIAARQPAQAQQEFHDMVMQGKFGSKTNAIGLQLLAEASERGDVDSFFSIATDLQMATTDAGRAVQILNVLKELKGVGSAYYMQRYVERLNNQYDDQIQSGKMQPITVPQELMDQLARAKTVDEINAAEDAVGKEIARQLPLTWKARLNNWRHLSMLGSPLTQFRNLAGNLTMMGKNAAKDVVAPAVQRVAEFAGLANESDRTHALLSSADKSYWETFAEQSYKEQQRHLSGTDKFGVKSSTNQYMRMFDTKWLNALAKGSENGKNVLTKNGILGMLNVVDDMFIKPQYKAALKQYMKAQGYTLNAEGEAGKVNSKGGWTAMTKGEKAEAEEWSTQQAWKATFHDASDLADTLNKLSNKGPGWNVFIEGVMPYKKTPINIAKRGFEYSPAGIVMGTVQLLTSVKKGKMSAAQAIDNIASGITGTALMTVGMFLAKAGLIRAGGEDKKKYEEYLEDTGDQKFALKFGDYSIDLSALSPASIPLFMGVALQEGIENGDWSNLELSDIADVFAGALNPFMEMSFMSSLNSALQNYSNGGIAGAVGGTVKTIAQNYVSQYLPTLGSKVAQFLDPTRRTAKSSSASPLGGSMDYYVRSLMKKVPGVASTLQPDVDVWGRTDTKDSFGDWALDFANKFILPTQVRVSNRDAVDNELIRLVENTGSTDFLPSDGNKYFKRGDKTYNMTAKQYTEYSQDRGQASYAALKEVMQSAVYKSASDDEKAAMLEKALKAAQTQVNTKWKEILGVFDD
jgi:hypothetical protein